MQLLHEPKIRLRSPPSRLDKLHRLCRRPPKLSNQIRRNDRRASADALDTVYEDARVWVCQCPTEKSGRVREVGGEFAKGEVVEGVLGAVELGVCGLGDEAAHGREDVGDAETGEGCWVLCKGEVGHVETGHDFGGARWTQRVGRLRDGGWGPLGGGGGGGGHSHARWCWWSVTGGETETGSL